MAEESKLQYDESVVGVEVEVGRMTVSKEQILAYCAAIGETNPLYTDEAAARAGPHGALVAPPTFYTVFRLGEGPDPKVQFGNSRFNAGQHCEFKAPIRAGDTITVKTKVHEIYEKTGRSGHMAFLVRRNTYSNQDDQTVAIVDVSTVFREIER
jgi:acyl dehydratase